MAVPDLKTLLSESRTLEANCSGVYFLFYGEELVYVGKSWNCLLRIAEHTRKESDKQFTSWNYYPTADDENLLQLEKQLIQEYRPKYNVQFNSA